MLQLWVVYADLRTFPEHYYARRFDVHGEESGATDHVVIGDTLEAVRAQLPPGLVRVPKHRGNDLGIVEIWI